MRKWLILILIGWLALIPAAAFADVDIDVDIHKTKDKTVKEKLLKFKAALILALVVQITDKAAESETLVNQTNENNFEFDLVHKSKSEAKSIAGAGITSINQASGNMNNQANAVSVAVDGQSSDRTRLFFGGSFAESQAAADQKNTRNKIVELGSNSTSDIGSVSGTGIVGVNQASGHMNNQANAVSVAVGLASGIALSEADLGQVNTWNKVISIVNSSSASIGDVRGSGIVGVNQSSGHMNNQANVVSVAASTSRSTVLSGF